MCWVPIVRDVLWLWRTERTQVRAAAAAEAAMVREASVAKPVAGPVTKSVAASVGEPVEAVLRAAQPA